MAIANYCNVTTDLTLFCPEVERYQNKEIIEGWTLVSGQTKTYYVTGTGQVNLVWQNGVALTAKTSIALVEATSYTFWYDSDNDILYVHCGSDADPAGFRMEVGDDWDALKTSMRNEAEDFIDSVLSAKYSVPLTPRAGLLHHTNLFDTVIRRTAVLLICAFIAKRENPQDPQGMAWYKEAFNPSPGPDESPGLLNQILSGEITLQNQTSARELGGWNIYAVGTNTATQYPVLRGSYNDIYSRIWKFVMDTAGAFGTATWKVSFDNGTNYDLTLQKTYDASQDQRRFYVANGVWVEWPNTTYALNDTWSFEMIPYTDKAEVSKVSSSEVYR